MREGARAMGAAETYSLCDRLVELPEELTGEILNGQLHAQPRPAGPPFDAVPLALRDLGT